ncbi:hypothetical protein [Aureimonas jatrophae]|uniref:Uncharacterized protein n=1 Tax=Aureimonas jatrophae TaxID=1166073 RepID=A0A1H0N0N2_9HYPH|nr:hypothetical protein [Aureimonas jatrophae]MBB3952987.1 ubiquinone biosynthesis protein UbiJ [Aureimonas jatrophae]SDO86217.1 hypothetical protein SAMN05192530_11642 [Aureimonas jatrophae]
MADATEKTVPGVLAGMVQRDGERHGAIRAEIERNGTNWAVDEIDRLRHKVASLQARLTVSEGRNR